MDDSEKPFACPSPGCNMSFTNEDHLVVHKKKHDMVLNLGSNGKNTFVADQTPTPTRFIRNCEEVGLFQDLQNVNPFEETFRRAVEGGKTGTLSEPEISETDDTLHTPHIFPNIAQVQSSTVATSDLDKSENLDAAESPETSNEGSEESEENVQDCNPCIVSPEIGKNVEIVIETKKTIKTQSSSIVVQQPAASITRKMVETTQSGQNLSINGQEVQLLLKTADGKLMQLSAVPFCENRSNNYRLNGSKSESIVAQSSESSVKHSEETNEVTKKSEFKVDSKLSFAKLRLKEALTKSGSVVTIATSNGSRQEPEKFKGNKVNEKVAIGMEQRRKQEVLARNRASSMRARAKRKAWIQQLQKAASNANEKNVALQSEVKALRLEVASLRAQLLAHDNCSVTKAMEKGSLAGVESKTLSVGPPLIQNIHMNPTNIVSSSRKRTAILVESPVPQKVVKSSVTLSTKPPIILPKTDVKQGFVVQDMSALKIVQVGSILPDKDSGKRIVLVQNPTRRLEIVRTHSRPIIQLDPPTLKLENAASKCTGT